MSQGCCDMPARNAVFSDMTERATAGLILHPGTTYLVERLYSGFADWNYLQNMDARLTRRTQHFERHGDPSEGCGDLGSGEPPADLGEHLARDHDPLGECRFLSAIARRAHPVQDLIGYLHPGHFVGEKFRIAKRHQRPDAADDRQAE